jgi:hypothetical protein
MNRKFFKNPWFVGISGSIIASIISDIIGLTKIMSSIWSILKWVAILIVDFFYIKVQISLWFLILLPFLVIGIFFLILWLSPRKKEETKVSLFLDYTENQFGDVLYRWEYARDFISGKLVVDNITHYCPKCICLLVNNICPICHSYFWNKVKNRDEVVALITHHIETNNLNK